MNFHIKNNPITQQQCLITSSQGRDLLVNPFTNKESAYTADERTELGLHGLIPSAIGAIDEQLNRAYESFQSVDTALGKYIYLSGLQNRNETLFYRLIHEHIDEMMPIVYTPTVGEACQKYSHIYQCARGIHISYDQRHRMTEILTGYGLKDPSIIVVTDGERILGLGDLGVGGMNISIGKLTLYTLCAGVPPFSTIPICLDVGTENEELLKDPLYLGLRQRRIRGDQYQDFIDSFVSAIKKAYPNVLLQWEDFLKANALKQLQRFRDALCTFNDDIQGTAAVTLSGVYGALRITGQRLREQRIVIAGAGASAQGISDLCVSALMEDGLSQTEARQRIWTLDSQGLVTNARPNLEDFKATYARSTEEIASFQCRDRSAITLEETAFNVKPTILMGTSAVSGLFTESIIKHMARHHERPIIFALSNPNSKCECKPADAIAWSDGRAIVATGSPFAPVSYSGQTFRIGQCNNAFIFPGVGLGVWASSCRRVTDAMFLDAAKALAALVSDSDLKSGAVYPQLARIREISRAIACAVIRRAVAEGNADQCMAQNTEERVHQAMWYPAYMPIKRG